MNLSSKRYDVDDLQSAQEFYHGRKWTDGLPVVPQARHTATNARA
jgi:hypothetical protein